MSAILTPFRRLIAAISHFIKLGLKSEKIKMYKRFKGVQK